MEANAAFIATVARDWVYIDGGGVLILGRRGTIGL